MRKLVAHHNAIEEDYQQFAGTEAAREVVWYPEELFDMFHVDVLSLPAPTLAHPTITSVDSRTFVFVRAETIGKVTDAAANKVVGWSGTGTTQRNGMSEFGLLGLADAFRQTFRLPQRAEEILWKSRYVCHLYK